MQVPDISDGYGTELEEPGGAVVGLVLLALAVAVIIYFVVGLEGKKP